MQKYSFPSSHKLIFSYIHSHTSVKGCSSINLCTAFVSILRICLPDCKRDSWRATNLAWDRQCSALDKQLFYGETYFNIITDWGTWAYILEASLKSAKIRFRIWILSEPRENKNVYIYIYIIFFLTQTFVF